VRYDAQRRVARGPCTPATSAAAAKPWGPAPMTTTGRLLFIRLDSCPSKKINGRTLVSLIGLYRTECVRTDGPFRTIDELELATLSWVHWFNTDRLHSALAYATPTEHEQHYYRHNTSRQHPLPGEPALH
jgi:transposase InsO family protein